MKKTNEIWIEEQFQDTEGKMKRSKQEESICQLIKDLINTKQGLATTKNKAGKHLSQVQDIPKRLAEYC